MKQLALTGNEAGAYAMKQINPDVCAAYPITPQTSLMQTFAKYVSNGQVDTELILVESEHSAMSACVGASAGGARTMTATSSNGLALMWEILYIASGMRLPIVMSVINRALSAPLNIHCDHSDAMGARDSGWIQLFCENAQEAYDTFIQAVPIAEHKDVRLPIMVCWDGFIISHGMENVSVYKDDKVKAFAGEYKPEITLLDVKNPISMGPLTLPDFAFEQRRQEAEAMKNALDVIPEVGRKFGEIFGKTYGFIEGYQLADAEFIMVLLGSTAGTARGVVDTLRKQGKKVGLLKIRTFRPFPADEIVSALARAKAVAIMDRADGMSAVGGPLFTDVRSVMYKKAGVPITNYIYGLGGRDIKIKNIEKVFSDLEEIAEGKREESVQYLGVRE